MTDTEHYGPYKRGTIFVLIRILEIIENAATFPKEIFFVYTSRQLSRKHLKVYKEDSLFLNE